MSLEEKLLEDIGRLQKELGFSGRSEVIRVALRMLLADKKARSKLHGTLDAILLVIHQDVYSPDVSAIRHAYGKIIKTQIHNHLASSKCLEIFVLKGDAHSVKKLADEFQRNRKIEFVKLVVS